jgi:aspartate 1-decarboxylase
MRLRMMKGKLHRAVVTQAELQYEGSVSIDAALLRQADILPFEQVDIYDITNGARFTTYTIPAAEGSGTIQINGAAARLVQKGDRVIICAFADMEASEAATHAPRVVILGDNNQVLSCRNTTVADYA